MAESEPEVTPATVFTVAKIVLEEHIYVNLGLTPDGLWVTCSCQGWRSPLAGWASREDHEAMHRIHLANQLTAQLLELMK